MLEMIRVQLMKRVVKKKKEYHKLLQSKLKVCPKIQKKLEKIKDEAGDFWPEFAGGSSWQVHGRGMQVVVDLNAHTCSCRRWDLNGIPCAHAVACINENNEMPEDYVNPLYHVQTAFKAYSHTIGPTNGKDMWPKYLGNNIIIPPPVVLKKRGRRPSARRKEPEELEKAAAASKLKSKEKQATVREERENANEGGRTERLSKKGRVRMSCSVCKSTQHNKRWHTNRNMGIQEDGPHNASGVASGEGIRKRASTCDARNPKTKSRKRTNLNAMLFEGNAETVGAYTGGIEAAGTNTGGTEVAGARIGGTEVAGSQVGGTADAGAQIGGIESAGSTQRSTITT